jgi:predicted RND superfamily exporter protein
MKRLADLHRNRPTAVAIFVLVATSLAIAGLPRLQFDDDPRSLIRVQNQELAELDAFHRDFGPDDQEIVLVIEGDDLFTPSAIHALRDLSAALKELGDVEAVASLLDVRGRGGFPIKLIPSDHLTPSELERTKALALAHPLAVRQCLSADGRTTILTVQLRGADISTSNLERIVEKVAGMAHRFLSPAGLSFRMTGHPTSRIELLHTLTYEAIKFTLLGIVISGAISFVVFRSLAHVLVACLGPTIGVAWTLGGMAWLGVKIDPLLVILPALMFIIGFTDSVHLVTDMSDSRRKGLNPWQSAAAAVEHMGGACLLTAITTAVGFFSLSFARAECIRKFGLTCTVSTLVLFLAVQLVVPLVAAVTPHRDPRFRPYSPILVSLVAWLEPAYRWLLNRPRSVALVSLVATLACFLISFRLSSDHRWTESLPETSETVKVTQLCDKQFGGSMRAYVVVQWPEGTELASDEVLDALRDAHHACEQVDLPQVPVSLFTFLGSINGPDEGDIDSNEYLSREIQQLQKAPSAELRRLVVPERHKTAIAIHVPDIGAARLAPIFSKLEERLHDLEDKYPGFRMRLTGTVVVAYHNTYQMIEDLAWCMSIAGTLIFFITAILFRSPVLGILSVVPNIFPQAITASLLVLTDQPLTINGVLAFTLCLGLSVDDTIHFLMRFLEEREHGGSLYNVILRTFRAVGGVVIATSMVLIGGFLGILVSNMPAIRVFACLTAVTLVAAIVGDLIMLPSLLLCFSREKKKQRTRPAA